MSESWQMPWGGAQSGASGLIEQAQDFSQSAQLIGVDSYYSNVLYIREFFTTLLGYFTAISGGSVGAGTYGLYVRANVPTGYAMIYRTLRSFCFSTPSWAKTRRFKTKFENSGNYKYGYIKVGYPDVPGATPGIRNHFGIWIDGGTLYGSTANESAYTAASLGVTLGVEDSPIIEAVFVPGTSVTYYLDGVSIGAITTTLPSGSVGADTIFATAAYGKASATAEVMTMQEFAFLQSA